MRKTGTHKKWKTCMFKFEKKKEKSIFRTKTWEIQAGSAIKGIFQGAAISAGTAFLFYRSGWGLLTAVFFIPVCVKRAKEERVGRRRKQLLEQFKSGMQIVAGSLGAGYSMENAWRNAQVEMGRLYGEQSEFYLELCRMNQKIRMNEPLEKLLYEFACDTNIEDIRNFAEIYQYARRSGGNITEIIRKTVGRMQEKADVMSEIDHAIAAKRAEQRMMNILLPGILLFITLSSPEYTDTLYHTFSGICVMSVCLSGYLTACRWSEKLMDIKV